MSAKTTSTQPSIVEDGSPHEKLSEEEMEDGLSNNNGSDDSETLGDAPVFHPKYYDVGTPFGDLSQDPIDPEHLKVYDQYAKDPSKQISYVPLGMLILGYFFTITTPLIFTVLCNILGIFYPPLLVVGPSAGTVLGFTISFSLHFLGFIFYRRHRNPTTKNIATICMISSFVDVSLLGAVVGLLVISGLTGLFCFTLLFFLGSCVFCIVMIIIACQR